MDHPKVTIIVPIYNVEKDLTRCVDSLINQTLKDIEIILVNDGSPDKCPELCDDYANQDNRIKVVHKKNGGLSDARNAGLNIARGQYILFVDSDDYIRLDACEILFSNASKDDLDIVIGDAIRIENQTEIPIEHAKSSIDKIMSGTKFIKEQLMYNRMHMAVWMNLYKRETLIDQMIFFKKGIYHEDEQWTPRVFLKARKVKYVNYPFYFYIIRENSITNKKNRFKNGVDLINTCYELEEIYKKIEDKQLKDLLNDYLVMLFLNAIHIGDLYSNKELCNKKFLYGKSKSTKNKIKVALFILNKNLYKALNQFSKKYI